MTRFAVPATSLLVSVTLVTACTATTSRTEPASAQAAAAEATAAATSTRGDPTLAELRQASERFRDVRVALAEGYIPDPSGMCITAEMEGRPASEGAMGIHYLRPDLLGITGPPNPRVSGSGTHTDFRRPAVLLYEPQADRSLTLVAIENLVFERSWRAAGNTAPPVFHGRPWDYMIDDPATEFDEAHGFEPHFDRHVWIFRENPLGVFEPMNPNVTCRHHSHAGHGR